MSTNGNMTANILPTVIPLLTPIAKHFAADVSSSGSK